MPSDVAAEAVAKFNDMLIVAEPDPDLGVRIVYVNPAFERITGYSAGEAVGRSPKFLESPETSEEAIALIEAALRERKPMRAELLNLRKDGSPIWIELELSHMTRPATGAAMYLFIERDISEHKRLVSQVIQSQRLESIGTLAGGIAHDLNNILAPVMMAGDLLADKVTDAEGVQILGLVRGNALRGAQLVRQILMFARGIEGQRVPVHTPTLLRETRAFLENSFPKTVRLRLDVEPDTRSVLGDASQLHQLLLNLCVNARDAMPAGGSLSLRASSARIAPSAPRPHPDAVPGDYVRIDVADTGTGIPVVLKAQIFDPFFTTKGPSRGSGLGLSTARSIAKAHGGFITFDSKEGAGTTFSIFLPAAEGEARVVRPVAESPTGPIPRGSGEAILVIDDEDSVREIVRASLEHYGYRVTTAALGSEAIALAMRRPGSFRAAVIDIEMPGLQGPDTISTLVRMEPMLAVVALSGFASKDTRSQAMAAGARRFLEKPFSVDTLLTAVHQAITGGRA